MKRKHHISIIGSLAVLFIAVWWSSGSRVSAVAPSAPLPHNVSNPTIQEGPLPKLEALQTEFDFGFLQQGESGEHAFEIRNVGEAPLRLKTGSTTCRCTLGSLERDELLPGETGTVRLEWKTKDTAKTYRQAATILTNDPEQPSVEFKVHGKVVTLYEMNPPVSWTLATVDKTKPTELVGMIYSQVRDQFTIEEVTSSHASVHTRAIPLDAEQLQRLEAKSGYAVHVTMEPGLTPGPFTATIGLRTDLENEFTPAWIIDAQIPGPVRIAGANWLPEQNRLRLPKFPVAQGYRATLSMFVQLDEQYRGGQNAQVSSEADGIHVNVTRDEKLKDEPFERFDLKIEIPPGAPQAQHDMHNPVVVQLSTPHPSIPVVDLKVSYTSY